jgi:hypothetical protein
MTMEEPASTVPASTVPSSTVPAVPSDEIPSDAAALAADIERTREELGETVQQLVAKTDVKAQAQRRATEVAGRVKGKAREVREQPGPAAATAAAAALALGAWLVLRKGRR